jgi:hypothetical protein
MKLSFKEECIKLRREGRSIGEIVMITGRAKSSIYAHIRDIPLTQERWQEIRKASGEHIRKFSLARKGKSERPFKTFKKWTPELVLLLGHLTFDGDIIRGKCIYNNRNAVLLNRVKELMRIVYEFEPRQSLNKNTGVSRISYYNVALDSYLKGKSIELLGSIETLPKNLQREFLRAFFDDEGCMDFRPARNLRQVRGYQKNVTVLSLIQRLLTNFGIENKFQKPNEVVIRGKDNLQRFQKEIGFSEGVEINGSRTNSIWKRSIEKRELLQMAIDSFKV